VSGAVYSTLDASLKNSGRDVAMVAAAIQQQLSR